MTLFARHSEVKPGQRLINNTHLLELLKPTGSLRKIAQAFIGEKAMPVRALLFDKTEQTNWSLGWHQDRTVAVKERINVTGFGHWSLKEGIHHVEPPSEILSRMITLRAHLDDCGEENAPLLVAPGSHKLGRVPVNQVNDFVQKHGCFSCLAKAGDVWVYSSLVLHASEAAKAPSHRRVLHVDFAAEKLPGGLEWLGI
jgi:ectoine hydroxylase-related dioxygenase (phytanoyl-CoA dioxygenase family)